MKSRFTIYVLLAAALVVVAKNYWLNPSTPSGARRDIQEGMEHTTATGAISNFISEPAVSATPADILLPPGPLPNSMTISILIQNNITTNLLRLSEPTVNVPGVGVKIRDGEPGKFFIAELAFPQGFVVPPRRRVEFRVKTNNPQVPVIEVPVEQVGGAPSAVPPAPATMPARPPGKVSSPADNAARP
jgi:hypothetical protein